MLPILLITLAMPLAIQGALVGGLTDIKMAADDTTVQFAVEAINTFYAKQGDNDARTLVEVVKAQSQVVAGTLYHFVLHVQSGNQDEMCTISVWSRPWLAADEAMQISKDPSCKPMDKDATMPKANLVGGENVADPMTTEVQNALNFAVTSMNAQENSMYQRKATTINKVTTQVVSGVAYHFYGVHMATTSCLKGSNKLLELCDVPSNANTVVCDFDVWWQSWMTPQYKMTNMNCKNL